MADYLRVVEFLRDARQSLPQLPGDDLRQAATQFADFCRQANDRLRQVTALLQQGLRTEAIASAEESPNLLDLVAALDLPDYQNWADYCQSYELPVPPPLMMDRATQLNDAYAADQPVEHLMAQHRLLALQRAGVGERLAVMRQIADAGAGGPNWEKDLRIFEAARIKELPAAFYQAVKNRDEKTIEALQQEIGGTTWLEPVPEDLRKAVAEAATRMRTARVSEELRALIEPLRSAFANGDEATCIAILERWQNLLTQAGVARPSAEITAEIEPVQEFLHAQEARRKKLKKYDSALTRFKSALDKAEPDNVLATLYQQLAGIGEPIPPAIEQAYRHHLAAGAAEVARRARARSMLIIGSLAALVLILGAAAYIYVTATSASSWAAKIRRAVAAGNVSAATAAAHDQEARAPQLNSASVILEAKEELKNLIQQTDQDALALAKIVEANKTLAQKVATQIAPENTSPDTLADAYQQVIATLSTNDPAQSPTLAHSDSAGSLKTSRSALDDLKSQIANRLSANVKATATTLSTQLDAVDIPQSSTDAAAALAKVDAISTQLEPLTRTPGLTDDTKKILSDIAERARQKHDAADQARLQLSDLRTLPPASASSDELVKAIKTFLARYPGSPLTDDLNKAMETIPTGKSVEAWRDLVSPWNNQFAVHTSEDATKRAALVNTYVQTYPQSPYVPLATTYADYLKQSGEALAEINHWQVGFEDLLQNPLIADLATFDTSTGQRFYVLGDPKMTQSRINNLLSITFEALNPKDLAKRKLISIDPPVKLLTDKPVKVPHARLASQIADALKLINEKNWESAPIKLIDTITTAKDAEPVVRAVLLQALLKSNATAYHWALGDTLEGPLHDLARQKPEELIWYDPDRPLSNGTLQALTDIVDALPKTSALLAQVDHAHTDLFTRLSTLPATTGVLLRDKDGLSIYTAGPTQTGDTAFVVQPTTGSPATLQPVATFSSTWTINPAGTALPQGTMVFITRQAK